MDNKTNLVPESIVYKLFDQLKDSSTQNDLTIKNMTSTLNDLASVIVTPPMNCDVVDVLKETKENINSYQNKTYDAIQNHDQRDEQRISGIHDDLRLKPSNKDHEDIEESLKEMDIKLNMMIGKVKTMIIIVLVAFSLMTVSYIFVRGHVDSMVQQSMGEINKSQVTK